MRPIVILSEFLLPGFLGTNDLWFPLCYMLSFLRNTVLKVRNKEAQDLSELRPRICLISSGKQILLRMTRWWVQANKDLHYKSFHFPGSTMLMLLSLNMYDSVVEVSEMKTTKLSEYQGAGNWFWSSIILLFCIYLLLYDSCVCRVLQCVFIVSTVGLLKYHVVISDSGGRVGSSLRLRELVCMMDRGLIRRSEWQLSLLIENTRLLSIRPHSAAKAPVRTNCASSFRHITPANWYPRYDCVQQLTLSASRRSGRALFGVYEHIRSKIYVQSAIV